MYSQALAYGLSDVQHEVACQRTGLFEKLLSTLFGLVREDSARFRREGSRSSSRRSR